MSQKFIRTVLGSQGDFWEDIKLPARGLLWCLTLFLILSSVNAQDNNCGDYLCEKEPKRVALVIGNATYTHLASIPSAISDAEMMRQRLTELGFEVELHTDVRTPSQFWDEIVPTFRQKLTTGDFIVFYFSGHGFAYGADNFVAPTDLPLSMNTQHVTDHAIAVESFKSTLETHSPGLVLFIIDACRSIGALEITSPDNQNLIPKGPAVMQNTNTAVNSIIAYATEPGHVALGSTAPGQLSPFTGALSGHISTEGSPFSTVFKDAAAELVSSTAPPQVPGTFDWSRTDPYLKPTSQNLKAEEEVWLTALTSDLAVRQGRVKFFLQRYSVSRYLIAARKWLADNPENDLASRFTRASPVAIDRAWRSASAEMVAIRRLSVPLAFARSLSQDKKPTLRESSDAEVGLVRSGINRKQIANLRTGQEFIARTLPQSDLRTDFYRNSLAYSLANIDAHGTMVAMRRLLGRKEPTASAEVVERIPAGAILQIKDVTVGDNESIWLQATGARNSSPFYFKLDATPTPQVLELGHSIKELLVPPRPGSLTELVDPAPIRAALAELKAQGWKITWISLSTAATVDEVEQETRAARMANAEYILKHSDVPLFVSKGATPDIADRITSVSGKEDFSGDSVRIRFFGIK